jgi:hypothetical protein
MMKQISTVRRATPGSRGVLRRSESPMATPGRSGLQESRCAGRSILPKWKWIFLTSLPSMLPEKRVWDSPTRQVLDKVGQNWPKLAKLGQGWPNLDKAGQIWTAVGQLFPAVLGCWEWPEECQAKTPALFLAGLRGSDSDRPLRSGNETTKKRPQNPALSRIGRMPIDTAEQKQGAEGAGSRQQGARVLETCRTTDSESATSDWACDASSRPARNGAEVLCVLCGYKAR